MASPFTTRSSRESRLWDRLLLRARREDAVIEINNLLAAARSVRDVSAEAVDDSLGRHAMKQSAVQPGLDALYERLYESCLVDHRLTSEEVADLLHLRRILRIDTTAIQQIEDRVSRRIYGQATEAVLQDNKLTREEFAFLQRLRASLRVRDE